MNRNKKNSFHLGQCSLIGTPFLYFTHFILQYFVLLLPSDGCIRFDLAILSKRCREENINNEKLLLASLLVRQSMVDQAGLLCLYINLRNGSHSFIINWVPFHFGTAMVFSVTAIVQHSAVLHHRQSYISELGAQKETSHGDPFTSHYMPDLDDDRAALMLGVDEEEERFL